MAERTLEIELLLKDKEALSRLKAAFDQMEKSGRKSANGLSLAWTELNSAISLIERGAAPVLSFMHQAIQESAAQEEAVNRLNVALKNQGVFTSELSSELQAMAGQMQSSSRFSDDAILAVQQRLLAIGNVAPQELGKVTQAVIDLATITGKDLEAVSMAFARAANGNTRALKQMGIEIDENIPKTQKLAAAQGEVNRRFSGAALADLNTYKGATTSLNLAWGEMLETFGDLVTKNPDVIQGLKDAKKTVEDITAALKNNHAAVEGFISNFTKISSLASGGGFSFGDQIRSQIDALKTSASGMVGLFGGKTVLEQIFGGEEAAASILETATATGEGVKNNQIAFEEQMRDIRNGFKEEDFQKHLVEEERKIEVQRQTLMAWHNEKTAAVMGQQQRETEFVQFALDTQKKAHESFWPTVGKLRDQFSSGLSKMFTDALMGTTTFSEAFKNMGKQMVATVVEYGVQLAVNFALAKALQAAGFATSAGIASATANAWAPAAALVATATFGAAAAAGGAALATTAALAQAIARVPGLESGGTILSPGRVLVGESGPEFLNLPRGATVTPLNSQSGQGTTINVYINISNPTGMIDERLTQELFSKFSEFIEVEARRL